MELQQLLSMPVPAATSTYTPISNREIHNQILQEVKDNDFEIKDILVKSKTGKNCVIYYSLADMRNTPNPEIGIRVGFKNSYDKTMSFGFALGSEVYICSNGMVSGEYIIKKQHRIKEVASYAKELIHKYFTQIRMEHERNLYFAEELKNRTVSEAEAQRIIGELYINNNVITNSQLRKMTSEMYSSEKFENFKNCREITAWDLYNHGTQALKTSANYNIFNRHIKYNEYFRTNFRISD